MGTTNRLWSTVEDALRETRDIQLLPSFDHADLVRGALDFANTGSLRKLGMQISGLPLPNGPVNLPAYQDMADEITARAGAAERQQLRVDLTAIVTRNDAIASKRAKYDGPDLTRAMSGRLRETGRMLVVTGPQGVRYLTSTITAPLAYVTWLLLDGSFAGELCRCRLERCGTFFLYSDKKRPKGRPFRFHCDSQHSEQDHNERRTTRRRQKAKPARGATRHN